MKANYSAYPEVLFADATYKLLDTQMPVYLFTVEDAMGQSHIVGVGILAEETLTALTWMLSTFVEKNPNSSRTRVVMADKDIKERQVFTSVFGGARILICLFHTLKTFRREVNCEKMGISAATKSLALELLQKLAYSKTDEMYESNRQQFLHSVPQSVTQYFERHWHPIRDQWVVGFQETSGNFKNATNNRLESLNAKIKQVIPKYSTLEQFCSHFFIFLRSVRTERHYEFVQMLQKKKIFGPTTDPVLPVLYEKLTTFAADQVAREYSKTNGVTVADGTEEGSFIITQGERQYTATLDACSCSFRKSMLLPCRHIFAVRKYLQLEIFLIELCATRWSLEYCKAHRQLGQASTSTDTPVLSRLPTASAHTVRSQQEKYSLASQVTSRLAVLASEACRQKFTDRLEVLKQLENMWLDDKSVVLCEWHEAEDSDAMGAFVSGSPVHEASVEETPGDTVPDDVVAATTSDIADAFPIPSTAAATEASVEVMPDMPGDIVAVQSAGSPTGVVTLDGSSTVLADVKVPPRIKRVGRPRGADVTAIGLPRKKANRQTYGGLKRPKPFAALPHNEKRRIMLSWFVGECDREQALGGALLLDDSLVQRDHTKLAHACLDSEAELAYIKPFFTHVGWWAVQRVVQAKRKSKWLCAVCAREITGDSVMCDCCLLWHDLSCIGRTTMPKTKKWFCRKCYAAARV